MNKVLEKNIRSIIPFLTTVHPTNETFFNEQLERFLRINNGENVEKIFSLVSQDGPLHAADGSTPSTLSEKPALDVAGEHEKLLQSTKSEAPDIVKNIQAPMCALGTPSGAQFASEVLETNSSINVENCGDLNNEANSYADVSSETDCTFRNIPSCPLLDCGDSPLLFTSTEPCAFTVAIPDASYSAVNFHEKNVLVNEEISSSSMKSTDTSVLNVRNASAISLPNDSVSLSKTVVALPSLEHSTVITANELKKKELYVIAKHVGIQKITV